MSDHWLEALQALKGAIYQDKVYTALSILRQRGRPDLSSLHLSELRVFSQNGEDGILHDLVSSLNPPSFFVSFGAGDGWSSNARLWADVFGWSGVAFEADKASFDELSLRFGARKTLSAQNEWVLPENVNDLLESNNVPNEFGILDIDIDGQDYWVWEAMSDHWKPQIVVCEYNSLFGNELRVVEEKGHDVLEPTDTWGASLRAVEELGRRKGYDLVYAELAGVNAFFIRSDLNPGLSYSFVRTPNYGLRGLPHPPAVTHPLGGAESRPVCEVE